MALWGLGSWGIAVVVVGLILVFNALIGLGIALLAYKDHRREKRYRRDTQ